MPRGISTLAGPRAQRILAGIGDQALVAVTSAGLVLVATAVLPRSEVVGTLYAAQIIVFLQGVGRALIGDILLTFAARIDDEPARRRQFDNAHAMALALSLIGMIASGLGIFCLPDLFPRDLLWGLPFIPAILLQDLARYTYQTDGQQAKALVIDLAWVTVEIIGLVGVIATGLAGNGRILTCWGVGAAVGAGLFYARTGVNPLRGRPLAWLRDTRHLLGWYTATGLLAQTTTLLIGTLVQGLLTKSSYAGFRFVQMLVLQPAQSLAMALNGLLVPKSSRLAGSGDVTGLHRQTRAALTVTAGIGLIIVAIATLAADPFLGFFRGGEYANVAVIALPVSLQTLAYLTQVPLTVAVRGAQRGSHVFWQYAAFSSASLTCLMGGAAVWDLPGAAWGLVVGAVVGLAVQGWMYRSAMAGITRPACPASPVPAG